MTAEQYRIEKSDYLLTDGDNTENLMRQYAKIKCKELLEIVAEKAEPTDFGYTVSRYSIMNAVDLDEFIV